MGLFKDKSGWDYQNLLNTMDFMAYVVAYFCVPENERGNVKGQIELDTLQVRFMGFG